jgi:hypothetical protein
MIELRETEVDALIRGGLLEHETRNDRNAVLKALHGQLHGHLNRTLQPAPFARPSRTRISVFRTAKTAQDSRKSQPHT